MTPMEGLSILATIGTLLQSLGQQWGDQPPCQRAISRLKADYPSIAPELQETLRALLSDEEATAALAEIARGVSPNDGFESFVGRFIALTAIPNPNVDDVKKWIARFVTHLREEALAVGSGPWVLYQHDRAQHEETRKELRALRDDVTRLLSPNRSRPAGPVSIGDLDSAGLNLADQTTSSSEFRRANELFRLGDYVAARAEYRAILDRPTTEDVDPQYVYRLYLGVAACSLSLTEISDAEKAIQQALARKPQGNRALALSGHVLALRGDVNGARAVAARILERAPEQREAWLLLIRVSEEVAGVKDLPLALQEDSAILLTLGERLGEIGELSEARSITRNLSSHVADDPAMAVSVAEQLLYLALNGPTAELTAEDQALVADLLGGLTDTATVLPKSRAVARAFAAQSTLRLATGDVAQALADSERAIRTDSECSEAILAWARALGHSGQVEQALFALELLPHDDTDPAPLILQARLLTDADRSKSEIADVIQRALDRASAGPGTDGHFLSLYGVASEAGLADLAERSLAKTSEPPPDYVVYCFRARLARASGDRMSALSYYQEAVASAPAYQRRKLLYECGIVANDSGEHGTAADVIETAGLDEAPDVILQVYVQSLAVLRRWSDIASVLDSLGSSIESLPDWALEVASVLALRRDDLEAAVESLVELRSRGAGGSEVEARLAHAYLRMGRPEKSVEFAHRVMDRTDLDSETRLSVAKLLFAVGDCDNAIHVAYLALRESPPDPLTDAVYVGLFSTSPDELPSKAAKSIVSAGTWIKLRAEDGEMEREYWLLSHNMTPQMHNELLEGTTAGDLLLGRRVGDSVVLQPDALDPIRYEIVDIKTIWIKAFEDVLARVEAHVTVDAPPLQALRLGDNGGVRFLSTITSVLHQRQQHQNMIDRLYAEQKVPVAVLGVHANVSCRDSCHRARSLDCGLLVDEGTFESQQNSLATASEAKYVVLHTSALVTLHELQLLRTLETTVDDIIVPTATAIELRSDRDALQLHHSGKMAFASLDEDISVWDVPVEMINRRRGELEELIEWIEDNATQLACPPHALSPEGEQLREMLGSPTFDAYALAGPEMPLFADDLMLRKLSYAEREASSFSTFALLLAAAAVGLISQPGLTVAIGKLISWNHQFTPVSVAFLFEAAKEDGYEVGALVRAGLERLVAGESQSGAAVFAGFARQLSVATLRRSLLAPVTRHLAALLLQAEVTRGGVMEAYRVAVRAALWLHPHALEEVDAIFDSISPR